MSRRRKRTSQRPREPGGWARSRPDEPGPRRLGPDEVERLLALTGRADARTARAARAALVGVDRPDDVVPVAEGRAVALIEGLWAVGWQPAELAWQAGRRSSGAVDAVVALTAVLTRGPAHETAHPAWRAQLDDLGPAAGAPTLEALVDLVAVLYGLPAVEVLLPVPGRPDIVVAAAAATGAPAGGIDAKVLERVRALLAKAESTSFEAEAQAFTAKAHELMTRHSLEQALVTAGPADRDRPTARRFCIDDPYADAKSHLLAMIADACRCSAVLLSGLQMVTVVGFADDMAEVDVLFTSLLVQAQTALDQLARASAPGSRERSRGFRSSFLRGFAQRIGDRLHQAGSATVAEVDRSSGGALVPVLAERREAVDGQVAEMHPRLRTKRASAPSDALGWYAGRDAADRADLPWERLDAG